MLYCGIPDSWYIQFASRQAGTFLYHKQYTQYRRQQSWFPQGILKSINVEFMIILHNGMTSEYVLQILNNYSFSVKSKQLSHTIPTII